MLEPPSNPSRTAVFDVVRDHWATGVPLNEIGYLPVGFGAHHWYVGGGGARRLFVTFDQFRSRHTATSLENAYASAASLPLDFVVAPLASRSGAFTVPVADGALSCTPWLDGTVVGSGPILDSETAALNVSALTALHASSPSRPMNRWRPLVEPDFVEHLLPTLGRPWLGGPFGEKARAALTYQVDRIADWVDRYHRLAARARTVPWVPTHGEPHTRNQMITPVGLRFVDWESLLLAPRERDLIPLIDAGHQAAVHPGWAMVELFDLEWRLDQISQYSRWLAAPHGGTASDRIALEGLEQELTRQGRSRSE